MECINSFTQTEFNNIRDCLMIFNDTAGDGCVTLWMDTKTMKNNNATDLARFEEYLECLSGALHTKKKKE